VLTRTTHETIDVAGWMIMPARHARVRPVIPLAVELWRCGCMDLARELLRALA